jgi:sarcosine oxidase subunit alpha
MATTFEPIRRSPIHHVHEHHHAQFAQRDGWLQVTAFTGVESELASVRSSVGVCDNSACGRVEIKGKGATAFAGGLSLHGAKPYRVHDQHFAVIIEPNAVEAVTKQLTQAAAGKADVHVIPTSSGFASFIVAGPNSEKLMRKISAFNFTNLGASGHAVCSVALTHTLVIRNGDRFDLHFPREFAEYMWETILDAGQEFHLHPFGTDTLAKL